MAAIYLINLTVLFPSLIYIAFSIVLQRLIGVFLKNWKSSLFFLLALLLTLSPILFQVFAPDVMRKKTVRVSEWQGFNERIDAAESKISELSKVLKQKTVVDGDQVLIASMDSRIEKVEGLFLSKAEIAVTIPLLRRDIEMMGKELGYYKESLSTTNNFVISLIGAIIAQLAAVFFFVRERSPRKESNSGSN